MNKVSGPRVPGSEHIPFNPINPWGRTPVVKRHDGSVVDWKNPLRVRLYQVFVEDREKGEIAVGPKVQMDVCDQTLSAIKIAIKSGKITGWANPHIKAAPSERAVARVF